MYLCLIRHGNAVPASMDPNRPLSSIGEKEVKALSDYLSECKMAEEITTIFHSGVLRAQQTAEILGKALKVPVEKMEGLQSEDPVEPILSKLKTWTQSTVLVSHLPYLPKLIWALTGDNIQLSTASCVCLKKVEDKWQVEWIHEPSDTFQH
jgi:phosphohistidine phosphatase SixA